VCARAGQERQTCDPTVEIMESATAVLIGAFGHNLVWGLPATTVIIVVSLLVIVVRGKRGELRRRRKPPR
jgi:hypothetical protein